MADPSIYYHERASRLLLQALGTGSNGFFAAYKLSQTFPGSFPWMSVLEDLCLKVPTVNNLNQELILKPKLTLLPLQSQRNLFSVLNCIHTLLPAPCIHLIAETVSVKDCFSDAWLIHLTQQFLKKCGLKATLQNPQVIERLQTPCKGLNHGEAEQCKLAWYKKPGLSSQQMFCESETVLKDDSRLLLNVCPKELCANSQSTNCSQEANTEEIAYSEEMQALPSSIKANVSILKQFLYLDMDSESLEDGFVLQLKKICDLCNPLQLQTVLISSGVSQVSTKCLFQFCVHLDSISPDLSYAHAKLLASTLFIDRVLSLTSPASRSLTAALTVFCKKYAQPACDTLIGPILMQAKQGSVYVDFLCRMISECLESYQLHLCFSAVLAVSCSEVSITLLLLLVEKRDISDASVRVALRWLQRCATLPEGEPNNTDCTSKCCVILAGDELGVYHSCPRTERSASSLLYLPSSPDSCVTVSYPVGADNKLLDDNFSPSEIEHFLSFLCIAAENFSKSVTFSKLFLALLTNTHDMIQPSHIGPLTSALDCNQTFLKKALQSALLKLQKKFS